MLASLVIVVTVAQGITLGAIARSRASAAADAAALAAADTASGLVAGVPCEQAARVASAHHTRLTGCRLEGLIATITVTAPAPLGDASATATAGPP
jgi:secretion/DNA translocation related TadE-like protein